MPDGLDRDLVDMAGGAFRNAAVATCNLARARVSSYFVLVWLPLLFC